MRKDILPSLNRYRVIIYDGGGNNNVVKASPVGGINGQLCGQYPCCQHFGVWRKRTKPAVKSTFRAVNMTYKLTIFVRQEGTRRWTGGLSTYRVVKNDVQGSQVDLFVEDYVVGKRVYIVEQETAVVNRRHRMTFRTVKSRCTSTIMWATAA